MSEYDEYMTDLSPGVIEIEVKRRFAGDLAVHVLGSVDSTNTWVKTKLAASPLTIGQALICAAEHQTAGRGRRGKVWHSPYRGVTFTIAFTMPVTADRVSGLSLLCGAALCSVLRDTGVVGARVKWPNDILVNGAKLCGVLIEVVNTKEDCTTVIVGTGVNYRRGDEAGSIDQESTDLCELSGHRPPDRSVLIGALAGELLDTIAGDLPAAVSRLADRWHEFDALQNKLVACEGERGIRIVGRAVGIDATGRLLVETADARQPVATGSVIILDRG